MKVIIAGAGGAAHLPGMTASMTALPVLGVPVESQALKGMDSLLSIVQMPAGVPVGTLAIGKPGAINAALLAAAMLATQRRRACRAARRLARRSKPDRSPKRPNDDSARLHHRHHRRRPARPDAGDRRGPARLQMPHLRPAREPVRGRCRRRISRARRSTTRPRSSRFAAAVDVVDLRVRESAGRAARRCSATSCARARVARHRPGPRRRRKQFIERRGARVAPWRPVASLAEVEARHRRARPAAGPQDPPLRL